MPPEFIHSRRKMSRRDENETNNNNNNNDHNNYNNNDDTTNNDTQTTPTESSPPPIDTTPLLVDDFPPLSVFENHDTYVALSNISKRRVGTLRQQLNRIALKIPQTPNIYKDTTDDNKRILLLQQKVNEDDDTSSNKDIDTLKNHPLLQQVLTESNEWEEGPLKLTTYTISRTYHDWSYDQVLQYVCRTPTSCTTRNTTASPHDNHKLDIPSSFETIGTIAHLNLTTQWLKYKYWIGKVLLDKHKSLNTVVHKTSVLGSTDHSIQTNIYRVFDMEVLAQRNKQDDMNHQWSKVTVKEEGCTFDLDYRKVYWNSRLAGEHKRLTQYILNNTDSNRIVVADLMAGVGPFAVPLTSPHSTSRKQLGSPNKKKRENGGSVSVSSATTSSQTTEDCCRNPDVVVLANDLNPASYEYLTINAQKNQCQNLHAFNMDARVFVHWLGSCLCNDSKSFGLTESQSPRTQPPPIHTIHHVIMNLPASAPAFLDAFRGWTTTDNTCLPEMHVYCFTSKDQEPSGYPEAIARCRMALLGSAEADPSPEPGPAKPSKCKSNFRHSHKHHKAYTIGGNPVRVRTVRNIAPSKNMVCVEFQLPAMVLKLPKVELCEDATTTTTMEPAAKRRKTSNEEP